MSHRDDPRAKYDRERDRLMTEAESGAIDPEVYEAICETLDALDSEKRSPTFVHDGEKVELASNTL